MLTYIVTGIVLIAISTALISGIWKASKYLVIPMQILIAIALLFIVVKIFFTSDNIKALNNEIEKSGIVDSQKKTAENILKTPQSTADQALAQNTEKTSAPTKPAESAPVESSKTAAPKPEPVKEQKKVPESASQPQEKKQLDPIDFM